MRLGNSSRANNRGPRRSVARSPELLFSWRISRLGHGSNSKIWDTKITSYLAPRLDSRKNQTSQIKISQRAWSFPFRRRRTVCTGREADDQSCHCSTQENPHVIDGLARHLATARPYLQPLALPRFPRTIKWPRLPSAEEKKETDEAKAGGPRDQFAVLWHVGSQINHHSPPSLGSPCGGRRGEEERERDRDLPHC